MIGVKPSNLRIPTWDKIVSSLATNVWAQTITQIPATVIGVGELRNVPYYSFHADSGGYELNVYGDPDHPAGVEIGVHSFRLDVRSARMNGIDFIASILARESDSAIIRRLKMDRDKVKQDSLIFEIIPPTDLDAYNGWWVSVYDIDALDKARASDSELAEISERAATRVSQTSALQAAPGNSSSWSATELQAARSRSVGSSSGGPVYVPGYFRKDGTYVQSHTRKR